MAHKKKKRINKPPAVAEPKAHGAEDIALSEILMSEAIEAEVIAEESAVDNSAENDIDTAENTVEAAVEETAEAQEVEAVEAAEPAPPAPPKKKKREKRRRMNYVRRLLLLVCIAVFAFSGYNLIESWLMYKQNDDLYSGLEDSFVTFPSPEPTETPPPSATETPRQTDNEGDIHDMPAVLPGETPSPQISYVQDYAPDVWPNVDFEGLRGINADTEAWLLCVGTNINYPVVHSKDNEDYLHTMFDGRRSVLGTLFVDYRNNWGFKDKNTVIYGHNARNHSMLWTLTEYRYQSFYDEHKTMRLILPDGKYELQIFAGVTAGSKETSFLDVWFRTDEEYLDWIAKVKQNSKIATNVEITAEDRVVTLSTCTYEFTDARFIVYGKMVAVE